MESLKIALVDSYARFGGGHIALGNLAYALSRMGHEVHMLLGVENIPERLLRLCSQRCYFHQLPGYSSLTHVMKIREKTRAYISRLNTTWGFDVIDAQGISGLFVPSLLQNRLIVTLHGNNVERGLSLVKLTCKSSEMCMAIPKAPRSFAQNVIGHFLYGEIEEKACASAKYVVTLTPSEAYYAMKHYSIPREKIRIIPNAFPDPRKNDPQITNLILPEEKKIILSVGALDFIKGTPILARAMKYVLESAKDVAYVSVGNGPLLSYVLGLRAEFPGRVIILPSVSEGLPSLYDRSFAFIQASLYEAFSLSMGEAMQASKPIIAFRLASIPDLVVDNFTGCLAKPVSARDLASKTMNLITDEEKARAMGDNARETVKELYSAEAVGVVMEGLLKEV